jgi:uncharacterized protein YndB with AHSA1/START domain
VSEPIVVERRISAPPASVYAYLTEADKWTRWQGIEATFDPRRGGIFSLAMPNGSNARGEFVELVPDARVVFTWGWLDHPSVPPGSSIVEIDLVPDGSGTLLTLTHRGLADDEVATHTEGWNHYLPRLGAVAQGDDVEAEVS